MSLQPDLDRATVHAVSRAAALPSRALSPAGWLRASSRRHAVLLAVLATLVTHLLSLTRRLGPDEGGFAMVARHWHEAGPFLYGPQWVDRPPGLIALFDAAQHLGPYGVRLTATLLAVGMVAALAWAADAAGGRSAARWAAWAGFAFTASVLVQAQRLNGELAAAACVTLSVAALLHAVRPRPGPDHAVPRALLGLLAGTAAALAVLMKQNFVDAFVFAGVLLAVGAATRANRRAATPRKVLTVAVAFGAGAAAPVATTLAWAHGHGGVRALAYAVLGFRADASAVMSSWSWAAPLHRLDLLVLLGLASGVLPLAALLAWRHRGRLRHLEPLPWAVASTATVEAIAVLGGENFWPHYLIGLIPMVVLAAGLSAGRRAPGWSWTRGLIVLAVAVTAVVSPVAAGIAATGSSATYTTGRWVAASARPGDSLVVPYSHANVLEASGLEPAYPYAWSLPARTLDPELALLTRTLDGPSAPTWVVRWDAPHTWGLDPADHVDAALRSHYRVVALVCGHSVWLHDGIDRPVATAPPPSECGVGVQ